MKKLYATLPTGEEIYLYTIKGTNTTAEIITYGATLRSLIIDGVDVAGGFDGIEGYLTNPGNVGGTIGRVSNRIENAIFVMDGAKYELKKNNGNHCLHGGFDFNHRIWNVEEYSENSVTLTHLSKSGDCGFPANLSVSVSYTLLGDDLIIDYKAIPDSKTPIALTNHAYFNLDGFGGDVKRHKLTVYSDSYTEVDENLIPSGNRPSVNGTVFDFRKPTEIGLGLETKGFHGYDHNFIITHKEFKKFGDKLLGLSAVLENILAFASVVSSPSKNTLPFSGETFLISKSQVRISTEVL